MAFERAEEAMTPRADTGGRAMTGTSAMPRPRRAVLLAAIAAAVAVAAVVNAYRPRVAPRPLQIAEVPGLPERYRAGINTMGTEGALLVLAPDLDAARPMLEAAVEPVRRVAVVMSTYRSDSEISRLNREGARGPVQLSPDTTRVLREAVRFSALSGGAFDVTYAPLRTLWRKAGEGQKLPSQVEIAEVLAAVGSANLFLADGAASFAHPGMEADLGGIAKGYAIDLAVEGMIAAGAKSGMVDIGGDIRVIGLREAGEEWKIRIRDPRPGEHDPMFLRLSDAAVATSGDYERYYEIEGQRLSHIVDPRTGWPVADVPSVTVVATDATSADALATAINVLGPEEGLKLIDSLPGAECMIMVRQQGGDSDAVRAYYSAGFRDLMEGAIP
jgi:thiamine biosynthesis lipoprotein